MNPVILQAEVADTSIKLIPLLMKGGVVMIPLLFLSVIALIIIIERLMFFSQNLKTSKKTFEKFATAFSQGKNQEAEQIASAEKTSWGRVFVYATISGQMSGAEMDKVMEDAGAVEISRLEKNLNYLSMIAGLAPLLGFIGTIAGVITIFYSISTTQDISISSITEGLYQKMVTSAAGLFVGIIAFTAHQLFQNRIDQFIAKMQEESLLIRVSSKK